MLKADKALERNVLKYLKAKAKVGTHPAIVSHTAHYSCMLSVARNPARSTTTLRSSSNLGIISAVGVLVLVRLAGFG